MRNGYEFVLDFLKKEGVEYNEDDKAIYFTFKSYAFSVIKKKSTELRVILWFRTSFESQDLLETCYLLNQRNKKDNKNIEYFVASNCNIGCIYYTDSCFSSDEINPIICRLNENRQAFLNELMKQENDPNTRQQSISRDVMQKDEIEYNASNEGLVDEL